jgi:hypothetical protein
MPRGVSFYDEARIQGRLWTPRLWHNRILYWLDCAAHESVIFSGGNVSGWVSRVGSAAFSCPIGPVYGTTRLNNLPVMTFNTRPFTAIDQNVTGQNITFSSLYMVTSVDASSNYPRLWSLSSTGTDFGSPTSILFAARLAAATQVVYQNFALKASIANSVNEWFMGHGACSAAATTPWANGVKGTVGSGISALNATRVRIGNDTAEVDSGFRGNLAENLLWASTLSDYEVSIVDGYFAWKWGLPGRLMASHPFRNRPPLIGD